jgi:hypothetical protein
MNRIPVKNVADPVEEKLQHVCSVNLMEINGGPIMQLYYSCGACSLSPHIVLEEGGFNYETERVDFATGNTETGVDYRTINPSGYVPALALDDGQILTEGPAPSSSIWPTAYRNRLQAAWSATGCRNGSISSPPNCTKASAHWSIRRRRMSGKTSSRRSWPGVARPTVQAVLTAEGLTG